MKLTAACAFGLEALVKRELIALGYTPKVSQPGRIDFEGDWNAVCRTNLWLRTSDRVLIEVQKFECPDFDALFETVKAFDWSQFIPSDAAFPVIGKSRLSQLTSVPAVQRTVKKALVESLRSHHGVVELAETGPTYKVEVAILNDVATLTIDTTGPSLHKRGYRRLVGEAPIKETLAAALVDLSVWNPERPLIDPFCGSGTIAIEAALIGKNIAPGISRKFACSQWTAIDAPLWKSTREEANSLRRDDVQMSIVGTDRDQEVLSLARYHAEQAGVAEQIHFQQQNFAELQSRKEYGCIITNPPYGERLEEQKRLIGLYESIPVIMQRLPTWSLFLITNMPRFEKLIQKEATRRRKLFNGRIECTYYQFLGPKPSAFANQANSNLDQQSTASEDPTLSTLSTSQSDANRNQKAEVKIQPTGLEPEQRAGVPIEVVGQTETVPSLSPSIEIQPQSTPQKTSKTDALPLESESKPSTLGDSQEAAASPETTVPTQPLFGELVAKDHEQAQLFHNRLTKRSRHLRRWPTKRGITCFRLYERDIPEIPLVVDRYENHLHITEYERPHERDIARHAAWLELMLKTAATALDIPHSNVFLKHRLKDRETRQYEKVSRAGKIVTVEEGGLKFLINLTDYVDTGLFLDHRITRQMVRNEAEDKDFLNLFAYTGSFSVYAAAAHASSTTTVDLSKNYLEWAKQNFEVNGLTDPKHQFVTGDTLEFLASMANNPMRMFDLAVVDPPTFSNSKRTEEDWDVQLRYIELLNLVHQVMRTGGVVYFSTNFRRFKFDEAALPNFECREISKQTVPEDFRNKRIHRCWRLVVK